MEVSCQTRATCNMEYAYAVRSAVTAIGANMHVRVPVTLLALSLGAVNAWAGQGALEVCREDLSTALSRLDDAMVQHLEAGNPTRAKRAVSEAARLFRFDRRQDALGKLDGALELLGGAWGRTMDADRRSVAVAAVKEVRRCIETHRPPALATLVVRTYLLDAAAPRGVGAPAGAGVLIDAEETRVGRTGADGVATVRVPPGEIQVHAQKPLAAGEAFVTLAPGGSGAVSVVLDPDKHDLGLTDLVLVEAANDIIDPSAASFTFKFMQDAVFLPMTGIDDVEIVDSHKEPRAFVLELFAVVDGAISARDPAKVQAVLAKYSGQRIGVIVKAVDAAGFRHSNTVWLRVASK